jgi:hypothetical protein
LSVKRSILLAAGDWERYATYAKMQTIHRRVDAATGVAVVWLSDLTRPFAIVNPAYKLL